MRPSPQHILEKMLSMNYPFMYVHTYKFFLTQRHNVHSRIYPLVLLQVIDTSYDSGKIHAFFCSFCY